MKCCEYGPRFLTFRFCTKLVCLTKPSKWLTTEKTLAYYEICPFSLNYNSVIFLIQPQVDVCPLFSDAPVCQTQLGDQLIGVTAEESVSINCKVTTLDEAVS